MTEIKDRDKSMTGILSFLKPAPDKEQIVTDRSEMNARYKYWRTRVPYTAMIDYVMFYFVRKNISVAMPAIQDDLGISKADLGLFLTLLSRRC